MSDSEPRYFCGLAFADLHILDVRSKEWSRLDFETYICCLTAEAKEGWLAIGDYDGGLQIWHRADGEYRRGLSAYTLRVDQLAILKDGRIVTATCYPYSPSYVEIRDLGYGDRRPLHKYNGNIGALVPLPDGRLAVGESHAKDGLYRIEIWDIDKEECELLKTPADQLRYDVIGALALLSNGRLASAGSDSTIRIWDVDSGECRILQAHGEKVLCLLSFADGRLAEGLQAEDGVPTIWIWDANEETCRPLRQSTHTVKSLAALSNGRLASVDSNFNIRIWNVDTGEGCDLAESEDCLGLIAVLPEGRLASIHWDQTIRVWDIDLGVVSATGFLEAKPTALAFNYISKLIVVGTKAGLELFQLPIHDD